MTTYDAIIIGAGQGGIPLAANLADAGWRVALIERKYLGGSCVNVGCTPTKAMVASARAAHVARTAGRLGIRVADVEVDLGAIVDRKDGIVRSFREGLGKRVDRDGLELIRAEARLAGPGRVSAGERELASERIVIDVGARPVVPPIDGIRDIPFLDSTTVMELREVPAHLVIVGGGYVGCEFGQMFRRFGADVTIVHVAERLLQAEDAEISDAVRETFEGEGIRALTGTKAVAARRSGDGVELDVEGGDGTETVGGTHVLLATGRRPATDDLGLETVGIETDKGGAIPVDARLRTSAEGVWAIGDANGEAPFTNVSYDDFRILYEKWVNGKDLTTEGRHHTAVVYVDPPVARVGLTEREARERGIACRSATRPMRHVARAIETGETAGVMKVIVDPESRRILGAAAVGLHADEVIHVFTAIMDADAPFDAIERGVYAHPTVAETLPLLVRKIEGGYA